MNIKPRFRHVQTTPAIIKAMSWHLQKIAHIHCQRGRVLSSWILYICHFPSILISSWSGHNFALHMDTAFMPKSFWRTFYMISVMGISMISCIRGLLKDVPVISYHLLMSTIRFTPFIQVAHACQVSCRYWAHLLRHYSLEALWIAL